MGENDGSAGWDVVQSIAMELDTVLWVIFGNIPLSGMHEALLVRVRNLPPEWHNEYHYYFGEGKGTHSILEPAAFLADVLFETDYSRATLAIRQMTIGNALERLAEQARAFGLSPDPGLAPERSLVDLKTRLGTHLYQQLGLYSDLNQPFESGENAAKKITTQPSSQSSLTLNLKQEAQRAVRILKDGDLHDRFWHWMDRFYFEIYHPLRDVHTDCLIESERHAITVLGARQKRGTPPDLSWLPKQNLLLRYPELQEAVLRGDLRVCFWVEPFGLADSWLLLPGQVVVSFSEPGKIYENFYAFTAAVAERAHALADPTRLIILRLIRNIGMTNTDMAAYLGLSRPTVSVHASILRKAGLIRTRQVGRGVRHEIIPEAVRRLFRDLERLLDLLEDEENPEN